MWQYNHTNELYHYGRKGMQWGKNIFGDKKKPSQFTAPNVRNAMKTYDGTTETTAGYGQKSTKTYTFKGPGKVKADKNPGGWDIEDVKKTMGKQKPEDHYVIDGPGKVKADKNPGGWNEKHIKKLDYDKEMETYTDTQNSKTKFDKKPIIDQPKKQEAPKQEQPKKEPEVEQPKNSVDMKTMANVSSNVGRNLSTIGQAVNQIPTNRPRMDLSQMTNKEMQERINRENLERQYNQLFSEPTRAERGKQKASSILSGVGTALTVAGSALSIAIALKQLRKKD